MENNKSAREIKRPEIGEDLLSLLLECGELTKKSAAKKLDISVDTINEWINYLEKNDWINLNYQDVEDPQIRLSSSAFKRLKYLEEELTEVKESEHVELKGVIKNISLKLEFMTKKIFRLILRYKIDIVIVISIVTFIYLLNRFIKNPDRESLSFLLASVLFSITIITYRIYKRVLRIRKLVNFFISISKVVISRKSYLFAFLISLGSLYFFIRFVIDPKSSYNLLGGVIFLTTSILIIHREKTFQEKLKFYIGMMLLVSGLIIISGAVVNSLSVTETVIGTKSRLIDMALGLAMLLILQLKESFFGVGVKSFRNMIAMSKE